jgi:hypothetical protein
LCEYQATQDGFWDLTFMLKNMASKYVIVADVIYDFFCRMLYLDEAMAEIMWLINIFYRVRDHHFRWE